MSTKKEFKFQEEVKAAPEPRRQGCLACIVERIKSWFRKWDKKAQADVKYQQVIKDFPDLKSEIKHLIRYNSKKFAIYITWDNDYAWETDDCLDKLMESKKMTKALSGTDKLVKHPCVKFFDYEKKKELFILVGSAMSYALAENYSLAKACRENAEQYINARKYEITRKWQLLSCIGLLAAFSIIFLLLNCFLSNVCELFAFDVEKFKRMLFCYWGVVGGVFSIIQSTGKIAYDCQSGRLLNFLQVFSKILTSMISGIFVIYLFDMGLIFSNFSERDSNACLIILCIVAGFSERLVPSIIDKLCEEETKEKGKEKDVNFV